MSSANSSLLYTLFVFNKSGGCLYHFDYLRGKGRVHDGDEEKLVFGMLFSMRRFVQRTSPSLEEGDGSFHHYTCSQYRLHFYRCPTGAVFVAFSDPKDGKVDSLSDELVKIYGIFVDTCVRNPLYELNAEITCTLFEERLLEFLRAQKLIST